MRQSSRPRTRSARRWGRSPEHAHAHAAAARVQARYPGLVIWFGETSGRFYVMDAHGLHIFPDVDAVQLFAWQRTGRPAGPVHRAERFGDGLDGVRESIGAPLHDLLAVRPDLAQAPVGAR